MDGDLMPVKIHEKDGVLGIYDPDYPEAMENPNDNVNHIYFHSGLDYYERFYSHSTVINLPTRDAPYFSGLYGTTTHNLPAHNLGSVPFGVIVRDNYALSPGQPVQTNGAPARYLTLGMNENALWLNEYFYVPNSILHPISINIDIHLFKPIEGNGSNYLVHEKPLDGHFEYDRGRITADKHFLRANQFNPEFYIRHGKTLDLKNGGMRHVTPGGGVINIDSYNGSFALSGDYGVTVNG